MVSQVEIPLENSNKRKQLFSGANTTLTPLLDPYN